MTDTTTFKPNVGFTPAEHIPDSLSRSAAGDKTRQRPRADLEAWFDQFDSAYREMEQCISCQEIQNPKVAAIMRAKLEELKRYAADMQ